MCYYGTWATYRYGLGKFDVSHINPYLCTHVIYAFAGIDDVGTILSLDPSLDLPDNDGRGKIFAFTFFFHFVSPHVCLLCMFHISPKFHLELNIYMAQNDNTSYLARQVLELQTISANLYLMFL